jgi:hypothetical protein
MINPIPHYRPVQDDLFKESGGSVSARFSGRARINEALIMSGQLP